MWDKIKLEHLTFGLLCLVALGGAIKWIIDTLLNRRRDRKQRDFARETEERQKNLSKDIEGLKAEYAKKQTIHKVQFETEFNIYKDLWKHLLEISNLTTTIDPYVSSGRDTAEKKNLCSKKIIETMALVTKTGDIVGGNMPFYSTEIFELCNELTSQCLNHLTALMDKFDRGVYTDKIGAALLEEIVSPILRQIRTAIRKRIDFIEETEEVE